MFAYGQAVAAKQGLILVDTKYEMGLTKEGELLVIDEVHTPDSSRYWISETYEKRFQANEEPDSLDKEFVRRMVVNAGYDVDDATQNPKDYMTDEIRLSAAQKYLELYARMTGAPLKITDSNEAQQAISRVLKTL
jgi:phosphoribosylaminoimidazole-succinocarboxamide synthase